VETMNAAQALNRRALRQRRLQSPGIDGNLARRNARMSRPGQGK
jgi:hypothetical protein